ncbi:hypothetical protein [Streptomyces violaceusniger]|uniref:Uncharacterized protein n=1 Tax=Streptomyces violaceusniger (strain Tu 4113) TaxID=653045 RepID=G2PHE0_STRV4|nr:hypothetical protein [Streptomyces violaceusniger]AEM88786.1 hypothetical protein Strvi_0009 [Streptomyces violaceusniger Tu 4113]
MTATVDPIEVHDYQAESLRHRANPPAGYHPAKAQEPSRVLTFDGSVLSGTRNGEGRSNWNSRGVVHIAVTGSGYAYGLAVAACNGGVELGEESDLSDLVLADKVDTPGRCQRPACRKLWTERER